MSKSKMNELLERLTADKVETVDEALERQKIGWLEDLGALFKQIREWLAAGAGSLVIEDREIEIAEEDLGPYRVPAMTIRIQTRHPQTVRVEPKGMRILGVVAVGGRRLLGASGRVDLTCGPSRALLLRFRDVDKTTWKLVLDDGTKEDLTSDSLASALEFLIGLE